MEKIYRIMNTSGKFNFIGGIIAAIVSICGCVFASFMIVNGVKLLSNKKHVLF